MTRKLVAIGCVAAATTALWTWCLLPAADLGRAEDLGGFKWIIFIRLAPAVGILSLGVGSLLIHKRVSIWARILAGAMPPVVGMLLMNNLLVYAMRRAPVGVLVFGLTTGCLVWLIAMSNSRWFDEADGT